MLIIKEQAKDDIQDAYEWYESEQKGLGEKFLYALDSVFERIAKQPQLYAIQYKDKRKTLIKGFPYQVIFELNQENIVVYAVFHSSRDPKKWQGRK